ncbi:MAG: TetR/AcrR family transcriptional regulator [Rhodospirillaceae bacterium]|nr:TetR/AcrR family transcriptional regulator [Rhodospirillaceae bacterium]
MRRKPRGEGYQRRDEILAAARSLILKDGADRVTIRAICARVGLTPPALYRHFKDKHEIVLAICNETFGKLLDRFRDIRAAERDPLAALRQMMDTYVRFALAHPDEYRLLFIAKDTLMEQFSAGIETDEDAIRAGILGPLVLQELAQHIGRCMADGLLRPGDPATVTEAVWAAGHGLAALFITHPHFKHRPHDALIAASIDLLLNGLLAERAVTPS